MSTVKDYKLTLATEDAQMCVLKDGKLDMGILIPMPEALKIQERSTKGVDIRYYLTKKNTVSLAELTTAERELINKYWVPACDTLYHKGYKEDPNGIYRRGKQYVENWHRYGYVSWQGWMQEKWGISHYPETYEVTEYDGVTRVYFAADDEPHKWLSALAKCATFTLIELKAEKTQYDYL